jgi:hypothetical protein
VIGFSSAQFLLVLATYLSFGALLGAVPGLLLTVLLRQARRSALWDAAIGVCGILVGLEVSSWAGMHVSFFNGHGLGFRGFLAERGLLLASCLTIVAVGARHARLRSENIIAR